MNSLSPNPRRNSIAIISFALHASLGIYVFVLYQVSTGGNDWTREWRILPDMLMMFRILAGLGVLTAILAVYWPRLFLKSDTPEQTAPLILDFANIDEKIQTMTILRMALAEATGIYGLVAAFMNRSMLLAAPFLVVALVVQFLVGGLFGLYWASQQERPDRL